MALNKNSDFDGTSDDISLNPFLIDPVLKILFSKMTICDLKKARLVSNTWNSIAICTLENTSMSTVRSKDNKLKKITIENKEDLEQFTNDTKNHKFFTRFKINFENYKSYLITNPELNILQNYPVITTLTLFTQISNFVCDIEYIDLYEILQKISKTLRNLRLQNIKCKCSTALEQNNYIEFQNLTKFAFDTFLCEDSPCDDLYYSIVKIVLNNSPKLSSAKISKFPVSPEIMDMLESTENFGKISQLDVIDWFTSGDNFNFGENLHLKDLKIRDFAINFYGPGVNWFLQSQAQSLRSLDLTIGFRFGGIFEKLRLVIFENLQSLRLASNSIEINWMSAFEPCNFFEIFPNLMCLKVNNMSLIEDLCTSNTKSQLKILYMCGNETQNVKFYQIEELFPNLEIFASDLLSRNMDIQDTVGWGKSLRKFIYEVDSVDALKSLKLDRLEGLEILEIILSQNLSVCLLPYQLNEFLDSQDFILDLKNLKYFIIKYFNCTLNDGLIQIIQKKTEEKFSDTEIQVIMKNIKNF